MTAEKEALVHEHLEWARQIAVHVASMLPTWFTCDDLVGPAQLALVRLATKYDAGLGVPFAAFARRRIYGACFDSVRRKEYRERSHVPIEFGPAAISKARSPEEQALAAEQSDVWPRVQQLPPRHALIILAFYAGDMTLVEIGGLLGVGSARVCQLHREALRMLKDTCEDLDEAA